MEGGKTLKIETKTLSKSLLGLLPENVNQQAKQNFVQINQSIKVMSSPNLIQQLMQQKQNSGQSYKSDAKEEAATSSKPPIERKQWISKNTTEFKLGDFGLKLMNNPTLQRTNTLVMKDGEPDKIFQGGKLKAKLNKEDLKSQKSDISSQDSSSDFNSITSSEISDSDSSLSSEEENQNHKKERQQSKNSSQLNKSSARRKKIDEVFTAKNFIKNSINLNDQFHFDENHSPKGHPRGNKIAPVTLNTQEGEPYSTPNEQNGLLFGSPSPNSNDGDNQPDSARKLLDQQKKNNLDIEKQGEYKKFKSMRNAEKFVKRQNAINSISSKKKNNDAEPDYEGFFTYLKCSNQLIQSKATKKFQENEYGYRQMHPEVEKKCILVPDDPFKTKWELLTSFILIFTAVTTPLQLAFTEQDDQSWTVVNYCVDCIFGIDIIVCFFSAYEGEDEGELEHDRCKIAKKYISSWFFIDLLSIIPVSEFLESGDFSNLARIARLPKLYRLIRMVKLVRIMKIVKDRNTISKYLNEYLKVGVAMERLSFFCFIFVILVHIVSCLWVILSSFEDDDQNMIMRNNFQDLSAPELYLACFYYTTVIVTTIGYGDITVRTPVEQVFALILLIIGVIGFSFAIGSLSSVLSSLDAKAGKLQEKMETLNNIREEYKIPYDLYRRLRIALHYDHSNNNNEHTEFLSELPAYLKVELSVVMHQDIMKKIKFLKNKSPHFIAFLMPLLRPIKVENKRFIYSDGDPIDEIYFLAKGLAGYVLNNKYENAVYYVINEGQYFGEIDFIFCDNENNNDGKRKFSAMAIGNNDCELLVLKKIDLLQADLEFEEVISDLFQNAAHRLKRTIKLKKRCKAFYKNMKRQQLNQDLGEQNLQMGQSLKEEVKQNGEKNDGILKSIKDKMSLFQTKNESIKNAFMDDLKKKMEQNNVNLEQLNNEDLQIDNVLSEDISTEKEDSDRRPDVIQGVDQKSSHKISIRSGGDSSPNKQKTVTSSLKRQGTSAKKISSNSKGRKLSNKRSKTNASMEKGQESQLKRKMTEDQHQMSKIKISSSWNQDQQHDEINDKSQSKNQGQQSQSNNVESKMNEYQVIINMETEPDQEQQKEEKIKIRFENTNLDSSSNSHESIQYPAKGFNFEQAPVLKQATNYLEEEKIKEENLSSNDSKTPYTNKLHTFTPANQEDEHKNSAIDAISGNIRWNLMKNIMAKQVGHNIQKTFKTALVTKHEHDTIQEKRREIKRRKSNANFLLLPDHKFTQPKLQMTEANDKILQQIENDNKIRYSQINERITKFENILGEISQIMRDLNQPPMSIQNMDSAGQGGIDEQVIKEQIKNLLRQAYRVPQPPNNEVLQRKKPEEQQ